MEDHPRLRPVKEHKGLYECSECMQAFIPNPTSREGLVYTFAEHLRTLHPTEEKPPLLPE
jgi:hypothetical protein